MRVLLLTWLGVCQAGSQSPAVRCLLLSTCVVSRKCLSFTFLLVWCEAGLGAAGDNCDTLPWLNSKPATEASPAYPASLLVLASGDGMLLLLLPACVRAWLDWVLRAGSVELPQEQQGS